MTVTKQPFLNASQSQTHIKIEIASMGTYICRCESEKLFVRFEKFLFINTIERACVIHIWIVRINTKYLQFYPFLKI